jgi:hypothetical protein
MAMLKEVQEVRVGGRTRRVYVRPFAWNLHAPTHMEWAPDGRLLVVERTTGKVKDVTKGGDMEEAKPFAWGLQGPSSTPWPHAYASPLMAKKCSSAHRRVGQFGK